MDVGLAGAFWAVSLLFVLIPGGDWAYAIAASLRRGGVVPAVSGMLTGHLIAALAVAGGLAALLAASPWVLTAITLAGALYLVWLGIGVLRKPPRAAVGDAEPVPAIPGRSAFMKGVGISLLNPKVFLLFIALLPQFVSAQAALPVGVQLLVLGAIHLVNCAVVYFAVGFGAAAVLARKPGGVRVLGFVSGGVMVLLGAVLLIEQGVHALT